MKFGISCNFNVLNLNFWVNSWKLQVLKLYYCSELFPRGVHALSAIPWPLLATNVKLKSVFKASVAQPSTGHFCIVVVAYAKIICIVIFSQP